MSVVLAQDDSGLGFYLLAKEGWARLGTPRISPVLGVAYGMRVELDYVNREVRAMVREGGTWVSLSDSAGRTVFDLSSTARALSSMGFVGTGRIDRLDGYRAGTRPYHRPHFYIRLR